MQQSSFFALFSLHAKVEIVTALALELFCSDIAGYPDFIQKINIWVQLEDFKSGIFKPID